MWDLFADISSIIGLLLSFALVVLGVRINRKLEQFKDEHVLKINAASYIARLDANQKLLFEYINNRKAMPTNIRYDIQSTAQSLLDTGRPKRKIKVALENLLSSCANGDKNEACNCISIIIPWLESIEVRRRLSL